MKKLILMLFLVVGGVLSASATAKRILIEVQSSYWIENAKSDLKFFYKIGEADQNVWPGSPCTRIGETNWYYIDIDCDNSSATCILTTNGGSWQTDEPAINLAKNNIIYLYDEGGAKLSVKNYDKMVVANSSREVLADLSLDGTIFTGVLDFSEATGDTYFALFPYRDGAVADWSECFRPDSSNDFELSDFINYKDGFTGTNNNHTWKETKKMKYTVSFDFAHQSFSLNPFFTTIISSVGYATFSSAYDVVCNAAAYYASKAAGSSVSFSQYAGNKIPANQGALLKGSGTVTFTPAGETLSAPTTNFLKASVTETELTTGGSPYNYILAGSNASDLGFYYVNEARTSGAGKAYLQTTESLTPVASARVAMVFNDESEATGIKELKSVKADGIFNLRGQRVMNAQKGLYIVNGKKMLMK